MKGTRPVMGKCTCKYLVPVAARLYSSMVNTKIPTIQELRGEMSRVVKQQTMASEAVTLSPTLATLEPRYMRDSHSEALIPLGSDKELRNKYVTPTSPKRARFGRILEDLDSMAGHVCFTFNKNLIENQCIAFVTALVDRIDMHNTDLVVDQDIKLKGHVSWVGKTSMDINMEVEQLNQGSWAPILDTHFLMVARDPIAGKGLQVNPLLTEGVEEELEVQHGAVTQQQRRLEAERSLFRTVPSEAERKLVHDLFLSTIDPSAGKLRQVKPEGTAFMEEAKLKTVLLCHVEERNLYGKIFGGYLMRQAFELAWTNAYLYCQSMPVIKAVDDIVFREPVEIGSLLFLSSQIVYTVENSMQVKVHAEVVNPASGYHVTTNVFHFIFKAPALKAVKVILPKTYIEAMMFLDGKRHLEV